MKWPLLIAGLMLAPQLRAETIDLKGAIERALAADPRISEQRHLVNAARALLLEVHGNSEVQVDGTAILGLAPTYDDGIFTNGTDSCPSGQSCSLREGSLELDGVAPWVNIQLAVIKPLTTLGKIENYAQAAEGKIDVERAQVRLRQSATRLDVNKAYYGYLTARDTGALLADIGKRLASAESLLTRWLEDGKGSARQSDLYALQSGSALLKRYLAQAQGMEQIALDGLRVLTGIGLGNAIAVADKRLRPVELPGESLDELQQSALAQRPEMAQVEAALRARRALVAAKRAEKRPNIFAGIIAGYSGNSGRHNVDNPYIYDPFNFIAATPVVGMQWRWESGVQTARIAGAQAELSALLDKASFARQGIPFQVAEQYHQVQAHHEMVRQMEQASRAGRRWMIAAYTDFEAGLEETEAMVDAFKTYVLAHSDYLLTVNAYNMHVAQLKEVVGNEP